MDSRPVHWGGLVRQYRDRAGLTQEQLAAKAGLSDRSIRAIERGQVGLPRRENLHRLADALGLSAAETDDLVSAARTPAVKKSPITVGILGPLTVTRHGAAIEIASKAQQLLLGLLALEYERVVPVDEIAEVLWSNRPPTSWRNRIQAHVASLRGLLDSGGTGPAGKDILRGERDGYRLQLSPGGLDADRFHALLAETETARHGNDHATARDLCEQALLTWRGRVLEGLDDYVSARPATQALHRAKVTAAITFADLVTSAGEAGRAIAWLADLARQEGLNEALHSRFMVTLAAAGEQDAAVQVYQDLRTRLAAELGIYPNEETQAAYRSILHTGTTAQSDRRWPTPAELPIAPPVFGGRDETVDLLLSHMRRPLTAGELPAPRIVLVHGMPGVGKTALGLRAAHALKPMYPDGHLHADLRGESSHPADPALVLGRFLRALGVRPNEVPEAIEERSAMLRTYTAGRRMLLMLDDAASVAQVLPLLPSSDGVDVLITSRNTLIGLPVTRLPLKPLPMESSRLVLELYLPTALPSGEAGSRIAAYCGGLPLALQIAAGRVANGDSLAEIAEGMKSSVDRLALLTAGELALPPSLRSAYERLRPSAQELLRRLALLPTRTIPAWAAPAVLDTDPAAATLALRELSEAHLLTPVGDPATAAHFRFHDLVRLFGASTAEAADQEAADEALLHWLHTADKIARGQTTRSLAIAPLGVPSPRLPVRSATDGEAWLTAEYANILDAIQHCARLGRTRLAAGLLNSVSFFLRSRYLTDELRQAVTWVLDASGDDPLAYAYGCEAEVRIHITLNTDREAMPYAERALEIFEAVGDHQGRALLQYHLQYLMRRTTASPVASRVILTEIIDGFPQHQDQSLVAAAYQALGITYREYEADYPTAIAHLEQALALQPDKTTREYGQILYSIGMACIAAGRHDEAERHLTTALRMGRSFADIGGIIVMLQKLSEVVAPDRAAVHLDEAEALARDIDQPWFLAYVLWARALLAERIGDLPTAVRMQEEALVNIRVTAAHNPKAVTEFEEELKRLRVAVVSAAQANGLG